MKSIRRILAAILLLVMLSSAAFAADPIGETLDLPWYLILVNNDHHVPDLGDLEGVARRMYNVFEDVLPPRQRARVQDIKNTLIHCGALGANMSGTGPTAFGLFREEERARAAWETLKEEYRETYLAQTV